MKKITVQNPANLPTISWQELKAKYEPNKLKRAEGREIGGLRDSIITLGFSIPMFIWEKGKFIVDGAGRFMALELLEYEGYEIPDIPFVPVIANSKSEAKRYTMAISSQYGIMTGESIADFTLDMEPLDLGFINLQGFDLEKIDWQPPKAKEIDMDKMKGETKLEHTCPKCQFKFSTT